jgi:hypothetical protein
MSCAGSGPCSGCAAAPRRAHLPFSFVLRAAAVSCVGARWRARSLAARRLGVRRAAGRAPPRAARVARRGGAAVAAAAAAWRAAWRGAHGGQPRAATASSTRHRRPSRALP